MALLDEVMPVLKLARFSLIIGRYKPLIKARSYIKHSRTSLSNGQYSRYSSIL